MTAYRRVGACLDYRAYVYPLARNATAESHRILCLQLAELGTAEPERLGVTYVRNRWGFLVLPPPGFPELKVSFFKGTDPATEATILQAIAQAIGTYIDSGR